MVCGGRPLAGVEWRLPLPISGRDDFGVYWLLDAGEFQNGRVNYLIHRGDQKEQCGDDKFWLLRDSREAWVVARDCKVHLSREEALGAK